MLASLPPSGSEVPTTLNSHPTAGGELNVPQRGKARFGPITGSPRLVGLRPGSSGGWRLITRGTDVTRVGRKYRSGWPAAPGLPDPALLLSAQNIVTERPSPSCRGCAQIGVSVAGSRPTRPYGSTDRALQAPVEAGEALPGSMAIPKYPLSRAFERTTGFEPA